MKSFCPKNKKGKSPFLSILGFTFIEVMIALVIFSAGVVMIFHSYLYLVDQMDYLTTRLYATVMLDNRIEDVERMLRAYKAFPSEFDKTETLRIGSKDVSFRHTMQIKEVEEFIDVFEIDSSILFKDRDRDIKMTRFAYISDALFE